MEVLDSSLPSPGNMLLCALIFVSILCASSGKLLQPLHQHPPSVEAMDKPLPLEPASTFCSWFPHSSIMEMTKREPQFWSGLGFDLMGFVSFGLFSRAPELSPIRNHAGLLATSYTVFIGALFLISFKHVTFALTPWLSRLSALIAPHFQNLPCRASWFLAFDWQGELCVSTFHLHV